MVDQPPSTCGSIWGRSSCRWCRSRSPAIRPAACSRIATRSPSISTEMIRSTSPPPRRPRRIVSSNWTRPLATIVFRFRRSIPPEFPTTSQPARPSSPSRRGRLPMIASTDCRLALPRHWSPLPPRWARRPTATPVSRPPRIWERSAPEARSSMVRSTPSARSPLPPATLGFHPSRDRATSRGTGTSPANMATPTAPQARRSPRASRLRSSYTTFGASTVSIPRETRSTTRSRRSRSSGPVRSSGSTAASWVSGSWKPKTAASPW